MPKLEQFPLDLRIRDINLKRGTITKADIIKHVESLPDSASAAEELIIQDEDSTSTTGEEAEEETSEDTDAADLADDEANA